MVLQWFSNHSSASPLLGVATARRRHSSALPLLGVATARRCHCSALPLLGVATARRCHCSALSPSKGGGSPGAIGNLGGAASGLEAQRGADSLIELATAPGRHCSTANGSARPANAMWGDNSLGDLGVGGNVGLAKRARWLDALNRSLPQRHLRMLDAYLWNTPNGYKVLLYLEEAALPYRLVPVNIGKGDQFAPEFLKISPNNKIPALVDTEPSEGKGPISIFESGAILLYLAEKTGKFLPRDLSARYEVIQWLFWQMAGLGPMAGQNGHFAVYAPEKIPYAIQRYVNETNRLYGVMNKRLRDREFLAGDYSIADIACYPWIVPYKAHGQDLNEFPNLKRWFESIQDRDATKRAYAKGKELSPQTTLSEEAKKVLFGQTAKHVQ